MRRHLPGLCGAGRGDVMRDATGTAVHGFRNPYFSIPGVRHAPCVGHIPRAPDNRVGFDDEPRARDPATVLRDAIHRYDRADGAPLPPDVIDVTGTAYDHHVTAGMTCHEAPSGT